MNVEHYCILDKQFLAKAKNDARAKKKAEAKKKKKAKAEAAKAKKRGKAEAAKEKKRVEAKVMAWKKIKNRVAKNVEIFLHKKQTNKRKIALFNDSIIKKKK